MIMGLGKYMIISCLDPCGSAGTTLNPGSKMFAGFGSPNPSESYDSQRVLILEAVGLPEPSYFKGYVAGCIWHSADASASTSDVTASSG